MNLTEAVAAALVLMVSTSAAAQLWSQALRHSSALAQRETQLQRLDALLLASEGKARELAASQTPTRDCQGAAGQLVPLLRALTSQQAQQATLTVPPSAPGLLHVRWEADGLRRERLLSASALGLCREATPGAPP